MLSPEILNDAFQKWQSLLRQGMEDSLLISETGQMLWGRFHDRPMTLSESAGLSSQELEPFEYKAKTDSIIWRYLSFPKFVSLLYERSLYFARGDMFEDRYEGLIPKANIDNLKVSEGDHNRLQQSLHNLYECGRKWTYVSCWHTNPYENPLMWDKYGKEGVCIQSTVGKLRNCLGNQARVFKVEYIDHESDDLDNRIPVTHLFHPFLHKRKYFTHEQEIRALVFQPEEESHNGLPIKPMPDLDDLIEHIFVNPLSDTWFVDLVKKIVKSHKLDESKVIQSDLNSAPSYIASWA